MAREVQEVRVQELLGRRVLAKNGRPIGRIEELRAEPRGRDLAVVEILTGPDAALERLAASLLVRALRLVVGGERRRAGYRVKWNQIDLADPRRPRLTCTVDELERLP
jgi:sporulation protein YlmC with PRC-barrel domain